MATHSQQSFIDTNITGTLNLLQEALAAGVERFFSPAPPAFLAMRWYHLPMRLSEWVTEDTRPIPENIYGVTKAAAEDLCQLFYGINILKIKKVCPALQVWHTLDNGKMVFVFLLF